MSLRVVITILFLLTTLLADSQARNHRRILCPKKSGKSAHFYGLVDSAMEIAYSEELNITTYDCSRRCRDDKTCLSYGYSKRLESCQLYAYDRDTGPEFLVMSSDYIYYDTVDTKTSNPHYIGSCRNNFCVNGACRVDCSERGYYCECTEGYRGEYCQKAYLNEPRLVQEFLADRARDGAGFSINNEHYLAVSSLHKLDESGNNAQADQIILRYDYDTEQYELFQTLTGFGVGYFMTAFQLTGKHYLFICNYRIFQGSQDTDSYLWVYDNSSDSFVVHQTFNTKGCVGTDSIKSSDGFYLFMGFHYNPSSYVQESPVYKWYPRFERFFKVDTISTTGVFKADIFELDTRLYVSCSSFRSADFDTSAEVWGRTDTYDLYRGCFVDSSTRAMDGDYYYSTSMTIMTCITYCRERGFPYAGLQAHHHCFCGDEGYDEQGSASDCNTACSGDNSEYCGGSYRNSVYMTEPSWSQTQVLPDSGPGSTDTTYYEHDGSHYLVLTRHHNGAACDLDSTVYVWNAGLSEWEHHQTIAFSDACPIGHTYFENAGEKFLMTENARESYSVSDGEQWEADCRVFRLEGTKWVDYIIIPGMNVLSMKPFERDGELYIFQTGGRNASNPYTSYSECTQKIFQWV